MEVSPTINSFHGRIRSITGTDPAAGAEFSITVPSRRRWRLLALRISFITDAGGDNRNFRLNITDGTTTLLRVTDPNAQTASLSHYYNFYHSAAPSILTSTDHIISIPPFLLLADYVIGSDIIGIQAGDNLSAPQLLVEEWIDP